jgi:hypothetical protein
LAIVGSAEADDVWQALDSLAQKRWGHGVDALAAAPSDTNCLAELLAREPLGLAGILLARGWVKKQRGEEPQACFEGAIAAAGRLRAALRDVGADDGDAEDVAFAAQAELILLAVARGEADIVSQLDALRAAGGHRHADTIAPACFITLVNNAAFEEARRITGVVQRALASLGEMSRPITHADASVIYCAATLEIQLRDGDRANASSWLKSLRGRIIENPIAAGQDGIVVGADLYWPAVDAEILSWRLMGQTEAADRVSLEASRSAKEARFPGRATA